MEIYNEQNSITLREGFITTKAVVKEGLPYKPEVVDMCDAVVVLCITQDLKNIYTTSQWRPCSDSDELGLVAGKLDKEGLDHKQIAIEEIEEEIRISRKDILAMTYCGVGFSSSGMSTEKVHRYIAIINGNAIENDNLQKASDTDFIKRELMPFNFETYSKMTSNTSQMLMNYASDILLGQPILQKIGVMGGTFSPCTSQHIRNMIRAIEMFNLDKLIIVPSSIHYGKKKLTYETRRKTIEMSIPKKFRHMIEISDIEYNKIGQTTYETMVQLRDEYGYNSQYYCIFGTDNIESLAHGWKHGEELLREFSIIAIERKGFELVKIYMDSKCQSIIPYGHKIHLIPPITENSISSSIVRNRILQGMSVDTLVKDSVLDFVESQEFREELEDCYK